jgi:1,2-beta-oligoglucan phosphorylase
MLSSSTAHAKGMATAMNVTSPPGLAFAFSDRGDLHGIEAGGIRIGLTMPSGSSRAHGNLYLRKRGRDITYTPLLGAESPSRFCAAGGIFAARGSWSGIDYECVLQLGPAHPSWRWQISVHSTMDHAVELDVVYVQDIGLKTSGPGLVNEYYVSQYLERRVFQDRRYGSVVCCRQNMSERDGHPWVMIASAGRAVSASTDGAQLYGALFRSAGEIDALRADSLGGELSGELSVVALQEQPFSLAPGASHTSAFIATYLPDHPQASSDADTRGLPELVRSFPDVPRPAASAFVAPAPMQFARVRPLPAEDLGPGELAELFGDERRHAEEADGRLLSFFVDGPRHVVLRAKELGVYRPHGHIMQTGAHRAPDESIMSTTAFACGVFNSHITQGNTNFNTLLAVCANPSTPSLASGQRIVVQLDDGQHLLGVPSAFEMGLNFCRWIYKRGGTWLQVCTWTAPDAPRINLDVQVLRGGPVTLWLIHHFDDLDGWRLAPGASHEFIATPHADSMIAARFSRPQFHLLVNSQDVPYAAEGEGLPRSSREASERGFVLHVPKASAFCMSFVGEVTGPANVGRILDPEHQRHSDAAAAVAASRELSRGLTLNGPDAIGAIREILPWYGMNALVHFLTPYGLEQFSGAAWGTRDVCQGPIDLLLCQEKYEQARAVLRTVFSNQHPDGSWPQWWMFDSYPSVRADSAHGDVIYWCILALCNYIKASGDFSILEEPLPYFEPDATPAPATPLREHVGRVIALVARSFVPGTALVQFGHGDWNDSLQPVSKDLARRLISSWTVQMSYQALGEYLDICTRAGYSQEASQLREITARILADFNRHLVKDGVVAGYGLVGADQSIDVLLHPSDAQTGVRYSLLPMNRGVISGVFSKEQAESHSELIARHLMGPDGARLMDRPLRYRGGPQTIFQRAESSTYFGREIGLMYVHEHLRYAESQARLGKAENLLRALRQAIPVDYAEVVPQGNTRQANCYYSSSDVLFESRYAADQHYDEVVAGLRRLEGGWRVYSSGPGIYVALVVSRLLGLRIELGKLIIDPVLSRSLNGLEATLRFRERPVVFAYHVEGPGFGPRAVSVNGNAMPFDTEHNPYRPGGAVLSLEGFMGMLGAADNRVEIRI